MEGTLVPGTIGIFSCSSNAASEACFYPCRYWPYLDEQQLLAMRSFGNKRSVNDWGLSSRLWFNVDVTIKRCAKRNCWCAILLHRDVLWMAMTLLQYNKKLNYVYWLTKIIERYINVFLIKLRVYGFSSLLFAATKSSAQFQYLWHLDWRDNFQSSASQYGWYALLYQLDLCRCVCFFCFETFTIVFSCP